MPHRARAATCAVSGLDPTFLRRLRDAAAALRIQTKEAEGPADPALDRADAALVAAEGVHLGRLRERLAGAIVAVAAHGDVDAVASALRSGADDAVTTRTHAVEVAARLRAAIDRRAALASVEALARLPARDPPRLVGRSAAIERVRQVLTHVALADAPVRIEGEPGTGKSLAARIVHRRSPRAAAPLFEVDGAAPGAAEVLLGAGRATGVLAASHGATVLIRSLDRLETPAQNAVAVWLRTGALPEGARSVHAANARLLTTTREPLEDLAARGSIARELASALAPVSVRLPPVRERRGDAWLLLEHFVAALGAPPPRARPAAVRLLEAHGWPGNVAEVRALAELVAARGPVTRIEEPDLVALLSFPGVRRGAAAAPGGAADELPTLRQVALGHVVRVLALHGGARGRAAKALGISPRTLYNHLHGRTR